MLEYYLAIALAGVMTVVGQLYLKQGANVGRQKSLIGGFFNIYVVTGYGLMGVATLASLYALKELPLMVMVIVFPMIQIGVVVSSMLIFGERVTRGQFFGIALVFAGALIFGLER